jgi:hypothetical protein
MRRIALLLVLPLLAACSTVTEQTVFLEARVVPVRVIALAPMAGDDEGSAVVTARVLAALEEHTGLQVKPPGDVQILLAREIADPKELAAEAGRSLGADALLAGRVERYRERVGGPRGAERGASVAFELRLLRRDGVMLWSGRYDELQVGLVEDMGAFGRAMSRNFRWVTAERLANYGAQELAQELGELEESWR